ncbi:Eukaryotic translation initiation factor 2 alpha kinase 4, partial [Cladochytrium tenue]
MTTSRAVATVAVALATVAAAAAAATTASRLLRMRRRVAALRRLNPTLSVHLSLISPLSPWVVVIPALRHWLATFSPGWELRDPVTPFRAADAAAAAVAQNSAGTGTEQLEVPRKSFAVVSPDSSWVYLADPEVVHELLVTRQREYPRPSEYYGRVVGAHNIMSADGDDWRRHRRVAAPQFSDRNVALVLAETERLAAEMFASWDVAAQSTEFKVPITAEMNRFALKVFASAGLGFDIKWQDSVSPGHTYSIEDSMLGSLRYTIVRNHVPEWIVPLLGKHVVEARRHSVEYDLYVTDAIKAARADSSTTDSVDNLLEALVRAADADTGVLSEEELRNDIFLFFIAGYFTTAGTLANAIILLADDPASQDVLHAEAAAAVGGSDWQPSAGDKLFATPKDLAACPFALAVMNEAMRLHPVVTNVAAWTGVNPALLRIGNLTLPERTHIHVPFCSLNRDPDSWGVDAASFRPERWFSTATSHRADGTAPTSPAPKGAFLPFSEGPRSCLGRRFAQTEFVALLSLLALRYRWSLPTGTDRKGLLKARTSVILALYDQHSIVLTR